MELFISKVRPTRFPRARTTAPIPGRWTGTKRTCCRLGHFEQTDEKGISGGLRIIEPPPHFPIERLDTAWLNSTAKSVVPSYEAEVVSRTLHDCYDGVPSRVSGGATGHKGRSADAEIRDGLGHGWPIFGVQGRGSSPGTSDAWGVMLSDTISIS